MPGEMDKHDTDNLYGPSGTAVDHHGRLQRAMEHARRVAGAQAAGRGVLDPHGAAIWLRFCEVSGLGGEGRN